MCLRFSQISNPVWSDRQVNKWSIELKLMFNCLLLLPSEESESKTQIPIKDIIYSLTLELGVVSEWILLLTIFKKIWAWYSAGKLCHNSSLRTWVSNPRSCEGPFLCSWQHQGHPHQAGHLGGHHSGRRTSSWPWEARGLPPRTKDVRSEAMLAVQCLMLPGSLAVNRRCDNGCVASGFYN